MEKLTLETRRIMFDKYRNKAQHKYNRKYFKLSELSYRLQKEWRKVRR